MFNINYVINMNRIYKSPISILIIFIFAFSLTSSTASIIEIKNDEKTNLNIISADIIIPDDYLTIQEGIDNATPGETIFVRSGLYQENIIIKTQGLSIIGENKYNTVIDANKKSLDGMNISASDVTIQGFTFTNALSEDLIWDLSGLRIYASNITIMGNRFVNNIMGLTVMASCYNATINNNSFIGDGILLGQYQKLLSLTKQDFLHDINNNTVNGKPLYYYKNNNNFEVPVDAGQVIAVNCSNITIRDLYLSNTDFSVILAYCDNSTIENITVLDTDGEVILFNSDYNIVQNNILINNLHGACLDYHSDHNIVRNNYVADNMFGLSAVTACSYNLFYNNTLEDNIFIGIHIATFSDADQHDNHILNNIIINSKTGLNLLYNSYNNTIENNTIKNCDIAIQLKQSDNNIFQNNNLQKNILQILLLNSKSNRWNNNYWNRPRVLPKIIPGLPYINFDWHPAKHPINNL
jgi:parallel beta-helix repeat protein